jgi:hypothetical protein
MTRPVTVTLITNASYDLGEFPSLRDARDYVRNNPMCVSLDGEANVEDIAFDERNNRGLLPWIVSYRARRVGMIVFAYVR